MSNALNAATLPLAGRHLIEASAGTGKTFNITRIYLRLLLERELSVEQILVMTFTRAATADLKGKIRKQLTETLAAWNQSTDDPFFAALYSTLPEAQAKARLRLALLKLDEAAIYTIHGFCKRALTQQAFNSGISFHADMEADTRSLIRAAVEDWYRNCSTRADFAELHAHWASPEAFLKDWADAIGHNEPLHAPAMPSLDATWRALQAAWPLEAEAFHTLNVRSRRKPEIKAAAQDFLDTLSNLLRDHWTSNTAEWVHVLPVKDDYLNERKRAAMPALAGLLDGLQLAVKAKRAQWALRGITFAREHAAAAKDRLDQLDFNDLVQRLRRQLHDRDAGPALAEALGQTYPAALVDEFQDTDTDQYAILQAIYGQAQERGQLLCMIGDPKQAIYGFRGGDVFAYLQARDSADFRWQMEANYRSTSAVINGYNRLFHGGPLAEPAERSVFGFDIEYHAVRAGKPDLTGLEDPSRAGDFWWCLLPALDGIPGKTKNGGYTKEAMEPIGQWCAAEIVRLLTETRLDGQALKPSDIALLVRDRNEATTLRDALRSANLESVYLSAQDNVLSSPEGDSLYRALNGILHLEDSRLLVAALSTPWLGYDAPKLHTVQSDEHAWARAADELAEWRRIWQTQGFMKMALGLYQQNLHPEPERHARTLTNALHLLELLQEASQRHRQPQALLHWFAQTRAELDAKARNDAQQLRLEADDDLIRIASLHGSKGLEYPVVFLPFVSYGKSPKGEPNVVRYHRRDDYNAVLALSPSSEARALHKEEQSAEDIRLLYVGATRAARRLYLVAAEFSTLKDSSLAAGLGVDTWQGLETSVSAMVEEQTCAALRIDHIPTTRLPEAASATDSAPPAAAKFGGRIERDWWLSSFSALTRNVRHSGLSGRDRDGDATLDSAAELDRSGELRFRLKAGAEAGNLLHDVLEHLDFQQPDWNSAMERAGRRFSSLLAREADWQAPLQQWIEQLLCVQLPSGAQLADLLPAQALRETEFYFPMQSSMQPGALAAVLAAHRGSAPPELPAPAQLKGMLHGFIDLVYHWEGRYYVVDYKSSHLGNRFANYRIPALTDNVQSNYYDLQYLLYTLALHRYLKTRLPNYQPAAHLGGVQYLYLRGMQPGSDSGIYHREADFSALQALDDYFRGQEHAA